MTTHGGGFDHPSRRLRCHLVCRDRTAGPHGLLTGILSSRPEARSAATTHRGGFYNPTTPQARDDHCTASSTDLGPSACPPTAPAGPGPADAGRLVPERTSHEASDQHIRRSARPPWPGKPQGRRFPVLEALRWSAAILRPAAPCPAPASRYHGPDMAARFSSSGGGLSMVAG